MTCKTCSTSINIITRQKCGECSRYFCSKCMDPEVPRHRTVPKLCKRCSQLLSGNFTRADLQRFSVTELKLFLTQREVDTSSCREKLDLIELVLQTGRPRPDDADHSRHVQQLMENLRKETTGRTTNSTDDLSHSTTRQARTPQPPGGPSGGHPPPSGDPSRPTRPPRPPNPPSYQSVQQQQWAQAAAAATPASAPTPVEQPINFLNSEDDGRDVTGVDSATGLDGTGEGAAERTVNGDVGGAATMGGPERPGVAEPTEEESSGTDAQQASDAANPEETGPGAEGVSAPLPTAPPPIDPPVANTSPTMPLQRVKLSYIKSSEEIEGLSIRQLKELLMTNYVDYKGCCERGELVERVTRLWTEHSKNSGLDTEQVSDEELCRVCMDAVIDCILLECGHMVTCTQCGKRMAECPICRTYVSRVVHVFKA